MEMNYPRRVASHASDESDAVALWEQLLRFQRTTAAEMDRNLQEAFGHSLDDYDVLHQVHAHNGPIRMGELAEQLLVANSSCTRLVGKLVQSGHLTRKPGDIDRREVVVALTPAGRKLRRRMAVLHTRDIERLVGAGFDSDAARAIHASLATSAK